MSKRPNPNAVNWELRRAVSGWEASLGWDPGGDGGVTVNATGESKGEAISRAAVLAEKVMDNPIVAALMPPQAKLAFEVAKKLGVAQNVGKLADVASTVVGPGAKRLVKALKFW